MSARLLKGSRGSVVDGLRLPAGGLDALVTQALRDLIATPAALPDALGSTACSASQQQVLLVAVGQLTRAWARLEPLRRDIKSLLVALIDSETGVRGYVLTGKPDYLEPFHSGIRGLQETSPSVIAELAGAASDSVSQARPTIYSQKLQELLDLWDEAVAETGQGRQADAARLLEAEHGKAKMDALRRAIAARLRDLEMRAGPAEARISIEQELNLALTLLGSAVTIAALVYAFDRSVRDAARRERAVLANGQARSQIERLFAMTDMLQSATDRDDANEVLRASAKQLLPGIFGALYVFNNSRDRLDLATMWGDAGSGAAGQVDHISPASCWALKRGKPHQNHCTDGALRCAHLSPNQISLELPMSARGELYGLLELRATGNSAEEHLQSVKAIASAMADAMSLALSNLSLREKLRNQALRDPLTGLYNRRFMEEMLDRMSKDAESRHVPLSVAMLDLDHFKALNDQFGHATGDAVLRAVANTITASLRSTDVACRYGGEELAILMPDCNLEQAVAKAEQIRMGVAAISQNGLLPPVSASIGISNTPETVKRAGELLTSADASLYLAKQQGRDRVVTSPRLDQVGSQICRLVVAGG